MARGLMRPGARLNDDAMFGAGRARVTFRLATA
jgi:hypothetical protein